MIYTLTLNPAIDYVVRVDNYKEGYVNRTSSEELLFGGKGINTSIVLNNLGIETTAFGFVGGNIGNEFERLVSLQGVRTDFVRIKNGNTRINIKLKAQKETEINSQGPNISDEEQKMLFEKINRLEDGDFLSLAGSIPPSLPNDIYVQIIRLLHGKNINIIVDAEKNLLTDTLSYKPFLIKPNHHELAQIFGRELTTHQEIKDAVFELKQRGARNVLVSMAGDGGIFVSEENKVYFSPAPQGKVVNSTGAGDSTIAGFLTEYTRSHNYKNAFLYGLCTGSASAFSNKLATKQEVDALYKNFPHDKVIEI